MSKDLNFLQLCLLRYIGRGLGAFRLIDPPRKNITALSLENREFVVLRHRREDYRLEGKISRKGLSYLDRLGW